MEGLVWVLQFFGSMGASNHAFWCPQFEIPNETLAIYSHCQMKPPLGLFMKQYGYISRQCAPM